MEALTPELIERIAVALEGIGFSIGALCVVVALHSMVTAIKR